MNIKQRAEAFIKLGKKITKNKLDAKISNLWFTPENIEFALKETIDSLSEENIVKWIKMYPNIEKNNSSKKIGVISAGNIPLVGFHDFLSVLITGNSYIGKFSSKDDTLLPAIIKILIDIEPEFKNYIQIKENKLSDFDAVIATGSNNSSRYFEYYFGKYPHIFRKNRNSVAVLTGNETEEDLKKLADDIFIYFGLGCRNVSKLFLPENYDLEKIFKACDLYSDLANHNKYSNNYGYTRSIYLMNNIIFWDNGFMLLTENKQYSSPVSTVYFEHYTDINEVKSKLLFEDEFLQCIVSNDKTIKGALNFGQTQKPNLWDYADNVDTMKFLIEL